MPSVRISEELDQRLSHICCDTHRTKSFYVNKALELHLEDLEDLYGALEVLEDKNSQWFSSEEVWKELQKDA